MPMLRSSFQELIDTKKEAFGKALDSAIQPTFRGLINPESYDSLLEKLACLNRHSFPRQARLVAAATQHLQKNNYLIVSAEMGTGKTQMGISTAYAYALKKGHGTKNLIMCPTHLVQKWAAEVKSVIGDAMPYEIVIVRKWTDLIGYNKVTIDTKKIYFFIVSKETTKLGYPKVSTFLKKMVTIQDEEGKTDKIADYVCPECFQAKKGNTKCENEVSHFDIKSGEMGVRLCNASYRQPEASGRGNMAKAMRYFSSIESGQPILRPINDEKPMKRRIAVAEYIKRQMPKGFFDLLIADEVHELKGGDTGQGNAFAAIASQSKKVIGLTGTLLNGYASSLFYILYRLDARLMKQTLRLDYTDVERFVDMFGAHEEVFQAKDTDKEGRVTKMGRKVSIKELPKISPHLMTLLLPNTIFLRLDEMNIALPSYEEKVELIQADQMWREEYLSYISEIASNVRKNPQLAGKLANDAISLPDLPYTYYSAEYSDDDEGNCTIEYEPTTREILPMTAKEQRALEICQEELAQGRKVLMFVTYTGLGTSSALEKILSDGLPGFKVQALGANVESSKREKWIKDHPCDVLICNPELVKTGLDLLEFPTIVFYQTTYNVFTLKQAARRSWRIGQEKDVKVFFLVYKDTPQQKALELISKKVATANSLEGRFSESEDLVALAEDESNLQVAMAKAILQRDSGDAKEIKLSAVKDYGKREWDRFELRYIEHIERYKAEKLQNQNVLNNPIVLQEPDVVQSTTLFEDIDSIESIKIDVEKIANEPVLKECAPSLHQIFDTDKIPVYRRVKKGSRWIEEKLEVTQDEIRMMVADGETSIQMSLFDF